MVDTIVTFNCEEHFPSDFPASARDLVTRLMDPNPATRLGSSGGLDAIKVPQHAPPSVCICVVLLMLLLCRRCRCGRSYQCAVRVCVGCACAAAPSILWWPGCRLAASPRAAVDDARQCRTRAGCSVGATAVLHHVVPHAQEVRLDVSLSLRLSSTLLPCVFVIAWHVSVCACQVHASNRTPLPADHSGNGSRGLRTLLCGRVFDDAASDNALTLKYISTQC